MEELVDDADAQAEWHAPEALAVEADRVGDELADGASLGHAETLSLETISVSARGRPRLEAAPARPWRRPS